MKRVKTVALLIGSVLIFSGCVPKVDTPKIISLTQNENNTTNLYWWKATNNPKLIALIDKSVDGSFDMMIAKTRVDEASNDLGIADTNALPSLTLTGGASQNRPSANDLMGQFLPKKYDIGNLALSASYTFDFWGENRAKIRSKVGALQASKAEYKDAILTISTAISDEYFRYAYLSSLDKLLHDELATLNQNTSLSNSRYESGIDNASNLYAYEAGAADIENIIAKNSIAIINSKKALANLAGLDTRSIAPYLPNSLTLPKLYTNAPQIETDNIAQKPKIAIKKALVYAANANADSAKAGFYPNISLNGLLEVASLGLNNLFLTDSKTSSFGASLYLPIFDRSALENGYKKANNELSIAIYNYNKEVIGSINDVVSSLASYKEAQKTLSYANKGLQAGQKNQNLIAKSYQAGIVDKLALNTAILNRQQREQNLFDAQLSLIINFDNIIRANGGIPQGEN